MTKIMPCTCKDEEQDKIYGKRMRVFNYHAKQFSTERKYKCTVCNRLIIKRT